MEINFHETEITDADVATLLPLTNLEGISFGGTNISDHAIEPIAQLPQLTRLNLGGTQVTDRSVPLLVGMALTYIDVADAPITPHGLKTLRTSLPSAADLAGADLAGTRHQGPRGDTAPVPRVERTFGP